MKRVWVVCLLWGFLVGCALGTDPPDKVVMKYLDAINAQDYTTAHSYYSGGLQKERPLSWLMGFGKTTRDKFGPSKPSITKTEIHGQTAEIEIEAQWEKTEARSKDAFHLTKVKGVWKIEAIKDTRKGD